MRKPKAISADRCAALMPEDIKRDPIEVQRLRCILVGAMIQSVTDLQDKGTGRDLTRASITRQIARRQVFGDGDFLECACRTLGHRLSRWRALAREYDQGRIDKKSFKTVVANSLEQLYE
jgi:hypothetical protein